MPSDPRPDDPRQDGPQPTDPRPDGPHPTDPRDEIVEHLPSLRAFAVSLTRNSATADDIVQDTIVKAWSNIDKFQPGTNMRAWLFTILRNTFYSTVVFFILGLCILALVKEPRTAKTGV